MTSIVAAMRLEVKGEVGLVRDLRSADGHRQEIVQGRMEQKGEIHTSTW